MCKLQICQERLWVPKHSGKSYTAMAQWHTAFGSAECKQAQASKHARVAFCIKRSDIVATDACVCSQALSLSPELQDISFATI